MFSECMNTTALYLEVWFLTSSVYV